MGGATIGSLGNTFFNPSWGGRPGTPAETGAVGGITGSGRGLGNPCRKDAGFEGGTGVPNGLAGGADIPRAAGTAGVLVRMSRRPESIGAAARGVAA